MTWRGLDHKTVYEMVVNGGQGVGTSDAAETSWKAAHQAVLDADGSISAALRASGSEWEGSGAEAMRTAFSPLTQWAVSAATSAARTAGGVGDQAVLAMETRRLVADNPPPQNFLQEVQDKTLDVFSWDGTSFYDDQANTVDSLMAGYETASGPNEQRFDTWSVPPTVVVTPATSGPSGPGGSGGVGVVPDAAGLAPAGGSSIASALAPGTGVAGPGGGAPPGGNGLPGAGLPGAASSGTGGATPGAAVPGGGTGPLPGGVGSLPGGSGAGPGGVGATGAGAPGFGGAGSGRSPAGVPGSGGAGSGGVGKGVPGGSGAAAAGRPGVGGSGPVTGGRGLGTGGVTHPSQRPRGSPGGSGTGPGPWSRAGTDAGRPPAGATAIRPVVPGVPTRPSTPDWRSVLLPPEREASTTTRTPGDAAARSAGPGASTGSTATPGAAAQAGGTRAAGAAHGMHPPMMGAGGGATQGEGRRRASYLIDDSDAFVDRRWVSEPVITPDDPL